MLPLIFQKILSFYEDGKPISGYFVVGDVYIRFSLSNVSRPLIFSFSNAAERCASINDSEYEPWGYRFLVSQDLNVFSFASIGKANWYRNKDFILFLERLAPILNDFTLKIGYGASMGGYGASAFSKLLKIDRLLLFNPISTLNEDVVSWETRFKRPRIEYDWDSNYFDGADTLAGGYVVYDPLYRLDKLHAVRYKNLKHLRFPGVGHGFPFHLQKLKMLKGLFKSFVFGEVNERSFYLEIRKRRNYRRYYKWMLSNENIHLTEKRAKVILLYKDVLDLKVNNSVAISQSGFESMKKTFLYLSDRGEKDLAKELFFILKKMRPDSPVVKNNEMYFIGDV